MKTATIYTLTNPLNGNIYYVGCTSKSLKQRLAVGHNAPTSAMLKGKGIKPIIEPVETLTQQKAKYAEVYWMEQFTQWGFILENKTRTATYPAECISTTRHRAKLAGMLEPYKNKKPAEKRAAAEALGMTYQTINRYINGQVFYVPVAHAIDKYFKRA